jgi:hypothetical protein
MDKKFPIHDITHFPVQKPNCFRIATINCGDNKVMRCNQMTSIYKRLELKGIRLFYDVWQKLQLIVAIRKQLGFCTGKFVIS